VITSHKKNVEIDWNWQELEEKEDCSELHEVFSQLNFLGHPSSNRKVQKDHSG
jgi:hypothetical protein